MQILFKYKTFNLQEIAQDVWANGSGWEYNSDGDCDLSMCSASG